VTALPVCPAKNLPNSQVLVCRDDARLVLRMHVDLWFWVDFTSSVNAFIRQLNSLMSWSGSRNEQTVDEVT
jgi:hypothetical protein